MRPIHSGKKHQILQLLEDNPFMTQMELSEHLHLSRSAVASHISALIQEGAILGRAYIFPNLKGIICIGGANIDRKIQSQKKIEWATSNPADVSIAHGGVARNIAENLGRMGALAELLTIVGNDLEGDALLGHCQSVGVNTQLSLRSYEHPTGSYTAILDYDGNMSVALADMKIYDALTKEQLQTRVQSLVKSFMTVVDTNLSADCLEFLIQIARNQSFQLCAVPVSSPKVIRLPMDLTGLSLLIANMDETAALTHTEVSTTAEIERSARLIQSRGCSQVIVTRGKDGIAILNKEGTFTTLATPPTVVVDVTGAGDAFVAGVLYALQNFCSLEDAGKIGMQLSRLTLQTKETVSAEIQSTLIQDWIDTISERT